jgi:hypothetical protein
VVNAQDSYLIYTTESEAKAALLKINNQYGFPDNKGSDTWATIEYIPTLNGRWCIPIENFKQWGQSKTLSTYAKQDVILSPKVSSIAAYKALEIKPSKDIKEVGK